MKLAVGILLLTTGVILLLGCMALSLYVWIRARINHPADSYIFFTPPSSLKTYLTFIALFVCGIALVSLGFAMIT